MSTRLEGEVPKLWGSETIWCTNDKYCGKMLNFNTGSAFSMHFHKEKDETWFVNSGRFEVKWIDTKDAILYSKELKVGDTWHNPPLQPHQLIALEAGSSVSEVSTPDSVEDNYRIIPGDSQKDVIKKNNPPPMPT